jgi:hypothetical protein
MRPKPSRSFARFTFRDFALLVLYMLFFLLVVLLLLVGRIESLGKSHSTLGGFVSVGRSGMLAICDHPITCHGRLLAERCLFQKSATSSS